MTVKARYMLQPDGTYECEDIEELPDDKDDMSEEVTEVILETFF